MYFGLYTLRGVEFWFSFDEKKLMLFPKDEANKRAAMALTRREITEGVYAFPGEPIKSDCPLMLPTNVHREVLVLYPISDNYEIESLASNSLSLRVGSWFLSGPSIAISGLSIRSDILDHAYDIQKAVDSAYLDAEGKIEVTSAGEKGHSFGFNHAGIEIEGYLSHARGVCFGRGELPIRIHSQLSLIFPETSDGMFLRELTQIIHDYLSFLAQGRGYKYDNVRLLKRFNRNGESYFNANAEYIENGRRRDCDPPKHLIPVDGVGGLSKCIFQSLSDGILVLEHLPLIDDKNSYNAARLIMMLAALDLTLAMIYKNGIVHSKKAIESKQIINGALDALLDGCVQSRVKKDVAWLKGILNDSESLQARISQFGKDHKKMFEAMKGDAFKSHQKRTAFFGRIARTRNKIAHGDFDIFEGYAFEDIEGTNRLLLASQLVLMGVQDDGEIADIVNEVY